MILATDLTCRFNLSEGSVNWRQGDEGTKQERKEKHEENDVFDHLTREEIHTELWETNDGESVVDDHENETTEPLNVNNRNEKYYRGSKYRYTCKQIRHK